MIVTVTPSPAIDWTVAVDSFEFDAVNRATKSTREASGKGVNVSWALHRAGVATTTVFPGGGQSGRFMDEAFEAAGLPYVRVETGREVRTNITLITPGHSTKINEPGVDLDDGQFEELARRALEVARAAKAVLICGSLPPSMRPDRLRQLVERLGEHVDVVVDTSGEALAAALQSRPALIKPNVHELAELVQRDITTFGQVIDASREAIARGAGAVLASLGADGAMYVAADRALLATASDIPFVNSVGAGDALLSGFVAVNADPAERLRNAVLWASSAVAHDSTLFPIRPEFATRITVADVVDRDLPLEEPSAPLASTLPSMSLTDGS
ncbi:1-phosphofructokinase family hexose kinase [uncultured Aeromicrobium sp.]|uniref:1-phosphofructokinase family hexose kinase n=1 Tax=uncultured Aeromicrobium sp. TaxID=337820 RepID=UPI0025DF5CE0|nr:1-phosphofructokinase family hexose kinase [uncultured Aeromicrobium sp.]